MITQSSGEVASSYVARGFSVLPVEHKGKRPAHNGRLLTGWQRLRLTESDLPAYFNGQPQNIGVLLGDPSGNLIDIDLDCPEAVLLAPRFLPQTDATFGRDSKRRSHWLYYAHLATKKYRDPLYEKQKENSDGDKGMLVEIRSTGTQTVFPGSTHESGEAITWDSDGEPALVDDQYLMDRSAKLSAASLLARYWPKGSRNDA